MASNQVKFYIYKTLKNQLAKRDLDHIAQIAWRAAVDQQMHPTRILIRSDLHDTTRGKPDPKGWHFTVCYKDRTTETIGSHVAYHAYTVDKGLPYQFREGSFTAAKPDSTKRGTKGEVVWDDSKIEEVRDIVYVEPRPATPSNKAARPSTPSNQAARPSTPNKTVSPPKPVGKANPPPPSARPASRGSGGKVTK